MSALTSLAGPSNFHLKKRVSGESMERIAENISEFPGDLKYKRAAKRMAVRYMAFHFEKDANKLRPENILEVCSQ
ncbi:hypothetical protein ISP15_16585 [Dyella jejuensis]|uniref:Uncharacterized protein n=1 Tax=Dyella jejuensis TaxID=1432009 RepID=A0ABW8JM93_9GAMM